MVLGVIRWPGFSTQT